MPAPINLAGQRFGMWTALYRVHLKVGITHWRCRCDCGAERPVQAGHLSNGASKGCGCVRPPLAPTSALKITHGACRGRALTPTYRTWRSMRSRVQHASRPDFHHYGGKGIRVCERWESYENFLADMGERPTLKHEIDRLDSDGHYEPGNCRWATRKEQVANLPQNQKGYRQRRTREPEGMST